MTQQETQSVTTNTKTLLFRLEMTRRIYSLNFFFGIVPTLMCRLVKLAIEEVRRSHSPGTLVVPAAAVVESRMLERVTPLKTADFGKRTTLKNQIMFWYS